MPSLAPRFTLLLGEREMGKPEVPVRVVKLLGLVAILALACVTRAWSDDVP